MKLVTAQEMKEIDKLATEEYGVPSLLLMDAAAKVVADEVNAILGDCLVEKGKDKDDDVMDAQFCASSVGDRQRGRVVVLCGGGNNDGDGFGAVADATINSWSIFATGGRRNSFFRGKIASIVFSASPSWTVICTLSPASGVICFFRNTPRALQTYTASAASTE